MTEGSIYYAYSGTMGVIKLVGKISYTASNGLYLAVEKLFADENIKEFVVDLRETLYIDSTNLGILARIATRNLQRGGGKPVIITTNEEINTILDNMGFIAAFYIVDSLEESHDVIFTQVQNVDSQIKNKLILEAHEALVDLHKDNEEKFHNVIELLKKDQQDNN